MECIESLLFVVRCVLCVFHAMVELKYRNVKFHVIMDFLHNLSDGHLLIGNMEENFPVPFSIFGILHRLIVEL